MDIVKVIKTRKSIRKFTSDPVPRETIREILEIACRAPSSENTQPWEFVVMSGELLDKIRQKNQCITYSDVIREVTKFPDSKRLMAAIAIGYPDWEFPANQVQSKREPIDNIITWCGI